MASPYNPGLRNATALGLAMGAEAAGTTAGVKNALALGAAMGATGAGTTAGVKNALALGAAMGTTGAGTTAGVKNALALGAAMGASGAGTTAGVKASLAFGALFTEGPEVTIVTTQATDVTIANPFAATVNFLIATTNKVNQTSALHLTTNVQTTCVIDVGPATTWSGSYIIGVVA